MLRICGSIGSRANRADDAGDVAGGVDAIATDVAPGVLDAGAANEDALNGGVAVRESLSSAGWSEVMVAFRASHGASPAPQDGGGTNNRGSDDCRKLGNQSAQSQKSIIVRFTGRKKQGPLIDPSRECLHESFRLT